MNCKYCNKKLVEINDINIGDNNHKLYIYHCDNCKKHYIYHNDIYNCELDHLGIWRRMK
jgi:hypothetical protein